MKESRFEVLMAKYLSGDIEPAERQELLSWAEANKEHRAIFEEMIQVWSLTDDYDEPFRDEVEDAWQRLEADWHQRGTRRPIPLSSKRVLRIAAAGLVIVALALWYLLDPLQPSTQWITLQTGPDEQKELTLPDGSRVWINQQSELRYRDDFQESRNVALTGEAYFEGVENEDVPFEVQAGNATATVLGTAFNLRAYPTENMVRVSVLEGRVAFTGQGEESKRVVVPGGGSGLYDREEQEVRYSRDKMTNILAWKNRRLDFEGSPLSEVIPAIERYYGIDIELSNDDILHCHFSGDFDEPGQETLLQTLAFALDLELKRQEGKIVLAGQGCSEKQE
ncbi:MAG: FecR domain-containing protein [Saprospiraceae bacterium]|nr:FecR domain-containing protein [Saprospiraceae bacterium]